MVITGTTLLKWSYCLGPYLKLLTLGALCSVCFCNYDDLRGAGDLIGDGCDIPLVGVKVLYISRAS